MKIQGYIVYRIYYDDVLVYVGRTKQPLQDRIRGHLFKKPMLRVLDIRQITKIEYATLETEADMNLYEIYYILKYRPGLNVDDKAKDALTVMLPELNWQEFTTPLWDKWLEQIKQKENEDLELRSRYFEIPEEIRALKDMRRAGEISEDDFYLIKEPLERELKEVQKKLWG